MSGRTALVVGAAFVVIGGLLLIREFVPEVTWSLIWPWASIALGVVLVVLSVRPARRD
jgi:hypothetical protein